MKHAATEERNQSDVGEPDEQAGSRSDPDSRFSILETTYGLLGSTPFDKLSMQRIADSAGVSKALLFYFFKSKRELVREALIFGTKREMEGFHSFMDDGTASGLSMSFPKIISHWMTNSLERIQILHTYFEVTDIEDPEDGVIMELRSMFDHIIGYLEGVLRENGMAYPREQATLMAVMIDTFGLIPHITPDPFDAPRYRTAFLDLFQFPTSESNSTERNSSEHNQGER